MANKKISVCVCTFNSAKQVLALLDCLNAQISLSELEVIVVDDGSTDQTPFLVREWMTTHKQTDLKFVSSPKNIGLPAARNLGLSIVKTEYVSFVDDDCRPDPNWIKEVLNTWANCNKETVAFSGPVIANSVDSFNRRYVSITGHLSATFSDQNDSSSLQRKIMRYFKKEKPESGGTISALVGANMSFRTSDLKTVFGFDTTIKFGSDDAIVSRKLAAWFGTSSIRYFSDVVMKQELNPSFSDSLRRAYKCAVVNGKNFKAQNQISSLPLPTPALTLLVALVVGVLGLFLVSPVLGVALFPPAGIVSIFLIHLRFVCLGGGREALLYPFAKFAEELADNSGFLRGLLTSKRSSPSALKLD
jgi:glycosyltransferase involved in cell wall biosynthesis